MALQSTIRAALGLTRTLAEMIKHLPSEPEPATDE
jgi:hypothetical protein